MSDLSAAPFPRRLAAAFYDALLLVALWFLATLLLLAFRGGAAIPPGNVLYSLYLLAVTWLYFAFQWTHGGQTLGMKAWRLTVRTRDGALPGWRDATLRFLAATVAWLPAGAGVLWALIDRDGMALHERLSGTVLVMDKGP